MFRCGCKLIFATWNEIVPRPKLFLGSKFEMKDMGETMRF